MQRALGIASVAGQGKRSHPRSAKPTNQQPQDALVPGRQVSTNSTPVMTPSMTPRPSSPEESSRGLTTTTFAEYVQKGQISQATYTGITSLTPPHVYTTPVQEQTLGVILSGVDVLAQAKTGTGKTLAFLIPSIEQLLRANPAPHSDKISVLILSPTRELAMQIEVTARAVLSATQFRVQHVVGGTNMKAETSRLDKERADILVATPGRMVDHLENSNLKGKLSSLRVLILDEADRLLEQGFRKELMTIINGLPNRLSVPRQTLLFSATVPDQVHQIASIALLPSYSFVSTVPPTEVNTHEHVPQHSLIAELNDIFPMTLAAIRSEIATHGDQTKIMAFLPTARATSLAGALFEKLDHGLSVWEIHSRMSQTARNKAADAFKVATTGIIFSSDVTARGMDFPGVTTVIQVGLPSDSDQYIHRLGRTARAGASGSGILILSPFEQWFLRRREIAALPLAPHPAAKTTLSKGSPGLKKAREEVFNAMAKIPDDVKAQAYAASLGFYKAFLKDCFGTAEKMVATFNDYAISEDGLAYANCTGEIPGMLAKTVGKMGIKGTRGLNIVRELPAKSRDNYSAATPRQNARSGRPPGATQGPFSSEQAGGSSQSPFAGMNRGKDGGGRGRVRGRGRGYRGGRGGPSARGVGAPTAPGSDPMI